jgi:NTE family protein
MAYHAGVLHALQEVGGFDPATADLVVGTSAGSVVAAYLRTGRTPTDFWLLALDQHPELEGLGGQDLAGEGLGRRGDIMVRNFRNPIELSRRAVGSGFVLARSAVRMPAPRIPRRLQSLFPAGLFAMVAGHRRFAEELPETWPERELWLAAVDITTGRRVVLGRGNPAGRPSLRQAVLASCAIPGVYPPVRIGHHVLVDGGAGSSTNLDLASRAGCDVVICIAPMAYDPARSPSRMQQLVRRIPARSLKSEVEGARWHGTDVLLFRPSAAELSLHGYDVMRRTGLEAVAKAAYETTARSLETPRFAATLASVSENRRSA